MAPTSAITCTKAELVNRVSSLDPKWRRKEVKDILEELLNAQVAELAAGNRLVLRCFGTFDVVMRAAHKAQNPRTLESVDVPTKSIVRFRPSSHLRELVAHGEAPAQASSVGKPGLRRPNSVEVEQDPGSHIISDQDASRWPGLVAAIHPGIHGSDSPAKSEGRSWADTVTAFEGAIEDVRSRLRFDTWAEARTRKRTVLKAAQSVGPSRWTSHVRRRPRPKGQTAPEYGTSSFGITSGIRGIPCDLTLHDLAYQVALAMGATGKRTLWQEERAQFQQVQDVVFMVFDQIAGMLAAGCRLELREYGVFEVRQRLARKAQNPRTREAVEVPAKRVVKFKPGRAMRVLVRDGAQATIDAEGIETLDGHPGLKPGLLELVVKNGEKLTNIDALDSLTSLSILNLKECKSLENVGGLGNLTELTTLNLSDCAALQNLDGLAKLTSLTSLNLAGHTHLQNIDALASLDSLIRLDLKGCSSLTGVDGLAKLPALTELDLEGCGSGAWDEEGLELTPTTREEVAACLKGIGEVRLRDQEPVKCKKCGGSSFDLSFKCSYAHASMRHKIQPDGLYPPLKFMPGGGVDAVEEAWSSFEEGYSFWEGELWDDVFTPFDCDETINCKACGEELSLGFDVSRNWKRYDQDDLNRELGLPQHCGRSMRLVAEGAEAFSANALLGGEDHNSGKLVGDDGAVRCPVCGKWDLYLAFRPTEIEHNVSHRTDRIVGASGSISLDNPCVADFKNQGPKRPGSACLWDWEWDTTQFFGFEDEVTELHSNCVEFGCSKCWYASSDVHSIDNSEMASAILAAAAIASAMRSLSDMELLDLAAIAKDLDEDTGGLAEAAMTWIDSASNDAKVCEVAKEMLGALGNYDAHTDSAQSNEGGAD